MILSRYYEFGAFSGCVLLAGREGIIHKGSLGFADRVWRIPNRPGTGFLLGSNTKQFTAMLVMQLVERGLLSLDGTLDCYLPYFRADWGRVITVRHLLNHTSGIPNYNRDPSFRIDGVYVSQTNEKVIRELTRGDLEFEPGTAFSYCNTGYYILGDVIERAACKPYEEVLSENIVRPLGLKNTGYFRPEKTCAGIARGYEQGPDGLRAAEVMGARYGFAAGNIYSCVEDLYLWDRSLYTEALLSQKYIDMMFTPHQQNYACGWAVARVRHGELGAFLADPLNYAGLPPCGAGQGNLIIMHRGSVFGFDSLVIRMTAERRLIVLLRNTAHDIFLEEIAYDIIRAVPDKGN